MLTEKEIKEIIPNELREFKKLQKGKNPSAFDKWGTDSNGNVYLYYFVDVVTKKNKKRVPVNEIIEAENYYLQHNHFDREDYKRLCTIANSDGGCGFTVIGRILEHIHGARYLGRGKGFR